MLDVGKYLKRLRKRTGQTQQDIADSTGIHRVNICQIESNVHKIPVLRLMDTAAAYKEDPFTFVVKILKAQRPELHKFVMEFLEVTRNEPNV